MDYPSLLLITFSKMPLKYLNETLLNSLRANFFIGNINMYLHFMSFLRTDMAKIIEILPRIRPGLTYFT